MSRPSPSGSGKCASKDHTRAYKHPLNPAPLEDDDDPLFSPSAFLPESPKSRRQSRKTKSDFTSKKGKNRAAKEIPQRSSKHLDAVARFIKVPRQSIPQARTPFSEYFVGLDLKLVSESEAEPNEDREDNEDVEDEDGSEADDETDIEVSKSRLRHSTASQSSQRACTSQSTSRVPSVSSQKADDSATEPETDEEPIRFLIRPSNSLCRLRTSNNSSLKRKSPAGDPPPAKKAKVDNSNADDSLTEPETESVTEPETESETEPETEDEIPQARLVPRPQIPRTADQPLLRPYRLDDGKPSSIRTRVQVPASINTFLRDYQRDGVKFFWERFRDGQGGLLGDDMGLVRKTIQVISFLSAIMRKSGDIRDLNRRQEHVSRLQDDESWKKHRTLPPANATWPTCLIVAPSSVVPNWEREFEKWGYFEVGVYSSGKDRADVLKDFKFGRLDVVLTTFDLARRDIALLDDLAWSCIIVDEVHRVKNPKSKLTDAFTEFHCQCRFGLTGTAIQNSYSELWNILNWTNPGCVGTEHEWASYVSRPLVRGQSKSATAEEQSQAYEVARVLKDVILPKFFLRRTKDRIKDQLPAKTDEVVFCPMASKQIEVYKRILQTQSVRNMIRKDEPCDCGSIEKRKNCCHPYEQGDLFKYISALIKVSNHLALILPAPGDTTEQIARNRELSKQAFPGGRAPKYGPTMLIPQYCGKWLVLEALLKEWHKDRSNKVLIFTKSVKLLDMLEYHLSSQGLGHVKLDGSVKQSERMPLIDRFHEDPDIFVFLISTLAGGTGLNLTGANKVVIFDPNWNPAHDLQAMDRAYRYGQTRDVSVYRLLGAGSIEELIYARQVYKQQQMAVGYSASVQTRYFEGVQGDKTKEGELFGVRNIFKLHEGPLATQMTIERATLSDLDWALANMQAPYRPGDAKWVYEAEAKGKKEHGDLNGLGALLFDDAVTPKTDVDAIQKTLKDIGVQYTHRNDDLVAENAIQGQRLKQIISEEKKKARRVSKVVAKNGKQTLQHEKTWPPKRRHHKPAPTPEQKLQARLQALMELGMIAGPEDLSSFARDFARKTPEEQGEILHRLDHQTNKANAKK